ncbi:hypothetical protein DMC30DRAFT_418033, partial [Rhodotorula diobovata]
IFAEVIGLYGLIVALILNTKASNGVQELKEVAADVARAEPSSTLRAKYEQVRQAWERRPPRGDSLPGDILLAAFRQRVDTEAGPAGGTVPHSLGVRRRGSVVAPMWYRARYIYFGAPVAPARA